MSSLLPVTLQGSIVRLEPMQESHIIAIAEAGAHDELWKFTMNRIETRADAATYVHAALKAATTGTVLPFVTILQKEDRIVGSTRFANYDAESRRIEIGWTWLSPTLQRTGANVEAKLLMMTHAFERLGLNRVEFKTDVLNEKSRNALLGIGATEEGILRQHTLLWHGRMRDTIYYSVLASEWALVKAKLIGRLESFSGERRG